MALNKTTTTGAAKKKKGKSLLRRVNDWLHLWLGLISGIIVFIVSVTGCIWAFQKEISEWTQPYQFVKVEEKAYLPPSMLKHLAEERQFGNDAGKPGKIVTGVQYPGKGKAAIASYRDKKTGYMMVYLNPYNGEILQVKALEKDFFRFILAGHYNLWLPREIGQPVVCWSIGIFIILLITGLVMWWPKNLKKSNVDKSFKVKWGASFKRVNYDLHNVLGFYVLLGGLILGITGIYFGFKWVPKAIYWTASGGKTLPDLRGRMFSDSTHMPAQALLFSAEDSVWSAVSKGYGQKGSLSVQFAQKKSDAISISYNPEDGTYYKNLTRFFDRYTLQELKGKSPFNKPYEDASAAEMLIRMNFDIHVGAIGGITGKIIAFLISLVLASLPITGFLVWWGKRSKKTVPVKRPATAALA